MPFIIVIGASAGGHDAFCNLADTLPPDLDAAVFVVLHLSRQNRVPPAHLVITVPEQGRKNFVGVC